MFVAAREVHCTKAPVWYSVTARRPDASPATSPIVLFGSTTAAPPPTVPSSASYMSYGMFAPCPTNSGVSLELLPCFTGSSLASTATVVWTVYRPLAAVHEPMPTFVVAPLARLPLNEPLSVLTVLPFASSTATVTAWEPSAVATVPWFFTVTVKFTVLPAAGLPGVHATDAGTRSELCTGRTTSAVGLVKALLPSFSSMTAFDSSTFAVRG